MLKQQVDVVFDCSNFSIKEEREPMFQAVPLSDARSSYEAT